MSIPHRIREAHSQAFIPNSIFFATFSSIKDWDDCFHLKAIAVYKAICDKQIEIPHACQFFKSIARNCIKLRKEGGSTTTNLVRSSNVGENDTLETQKASSNNVTNLVRSSNAGESVTIETQKGSSNDVTNLVKSSNARKNDTIETQKGSSNDVKDYSKDSTAMMVTPQSKEDICGEASPLDLTNDERKTADSVFLVLCFLKDLQLFDPKTEREKQDRLCLSKHTQYTIADIIKIENQLPLSEVEEVIPRLESAVNEAIESQTTKNPSLAGLKFTLGFQKEDFYTVLYHFCCYYSPFQTKTELTKDRQTTLAKQKNLLECLHYSLTDDKEKTEKLTGQGGGTPAVKQLAKAGMRFNGDSADMTAIKFAGEILHLPELVFDHKLEPVLWNLVALENGRKKRPVTRYIQLLNELIEDSHDVRILAKYGCVRGRWGKEGEVSRFLKMVEGFAGFNSVYPPTDAVIEEAKKFYTERMGRFFVRNQPALIWVSSVAAASLVLTAIIAKTRRG